MSKECTCDLKEFIVSVVIAIQMKVLKLFPTIDQFKIQNIASVIKIHESSM